MNIRLCLYKRSPFANMLLIQKAFIVSRLTLLVFIFISFSLFGEYSDPVLIEKHNTVSNLINEKNDQRFLDNLSQLVSNNFTSLEFNRKKQFELVSKRLSKIVDSNPTRTFQVTGLILKYKAHLNNNQVGQLFEILSLCLFNNQDHKQAISYADSAHHRYELSGNVRKFYATLNTIGGCYTQLGDYIKASMCYLEIIKSGKIHGAPLGITYHNLAITYLNSDNDELAKKYFLLALENSPYSVKESILCDLAVLFFDELNFLEAQKYLDELKKRGIDELEPSTKSRYFQLLGRIEKMKGNRSNALAYFRKGELAVEVIQDPYFKVFCLKEQGLIYMEQNLYQLAILKFRKGFTLIEASDHHLNLKLDLCEVLSVCFSKVRNFEKAYEYLLLKNAFSEKVFTLEKNKQILELERKYQTQKNLSAILMLKKNNTILLKNKSIQNLQLTNSKITLIAMGITIVLLIFSIILVLKNYRTNQAKSIEQLHRIESEQKLNEIKSMLRGQEDERDRISKELHDGIANKILTLSLNAGKQQEKIFRKIYTDIRSLSHQLNLPNYIQMVDICSMIEELVRQILLQKQIEVIINWFPQDFELTIEPAKQLSLYRVLQELFINVIKHSQATVVCINTTIHESNVSIIIEDNGIGFDPSINKKGIGLTNIHSRMELLGGNLSFDSNTKGTTVLIDFPK